MLYFHQVRISPSPRFAQLPVGLFKQTWLTPAVWKRRYCKEPIHSGRSLAVIGIRPVLAQIVLVEQFLLHNR